MDYFYVADFDALLRRLQQGEPYSNITVHLNSSQADIFGEYCVNEMQTKKTSCVEQVQVLTLIMSLSRAGAEKLLVEQIKAMNIEKISMHVAYLNHCNINFQVELDELRIPLFWLKKKPGLLWPLRLWRLLRDEKFDVIHIQSPGLGSVAMLILLTRRKKNRPQIVQTLHSDFGYSSLMTRILMKVTLPMNDHIIAVSKEALLSHRLKDKPTSEVLIHGIAVSNFRLNRELGSTVRAELGIQLDELVLGTVARFDDAKDYRNIVMALKILQDAGVSFQYLAIGDGPMFTQIAQMVSELGLEDRVHMLGSRKDIPSLLSAMDIFVLGSKVEGWPVSVMEALSASLPVVSTRVGGLVDSLQNSGSSLFVEVGDAGQLAEAIKKVITNEKLRKRMAESAFSTSLDFQSSRSADRLEEIYFQITR